MAEWKVHDERLSEDQGGLDAWIRSVSEYSADGHRGRGIFSKLRPVRNPCYDLRLITFEERLAEAIKWFRLAAEQGYSEAQACLGNAYRAGEGVEADQAEALKWYRLAAEKGFWYACFRLGEAYRVGEGVEEDMAEMVRWYRLAADYSPCGTPAMFNLGVAYNLGDGVEKDEAEAANWFGEVGAFDKDAMGNPHPRDQYYYNY